MTFGSKGTTPAIRKLPTDVATKPRGGEVLTDRYWVLDDEGLYWWGSHMASLGWSPQCNTDRRLPDRLRERLYPDARVEFVPVVFAGHWDETHGFNPFRGTVNE